MTFIVVLVIALAWIGALWTWTRDRVLVGGRDQLSPLPFGAPPRSASGPLAAPRTAAMARRRRREVLTGLALLAVTTFVLARAWSSLWALHLLVDAALLTYGYAVLAIERPDVVDARPRLGPVLADPPPHTQVPGTRAQAPGTGTPPPAVAIDLHHDRFATIRD